MYGICLFFFYKRILEVPCSTCKQELVEVTIWSLEVFLLLDVFFLDY